MLHWEVGGGKAVRRNEKKPATAKKGETNVEQNKARTRKRYRGTVTDRMMDHIQNADPGPLDDYLFDRSRMKKPVESLQNAGTVMIKHM